MNYISYAESIRQLKEAWANEPIIFAGGVTLNHNTYYSSN